MQRGRHIRQIKVGGFFETLGHPLPHFLQRDFRFRRQHQDFRVAALVRHPHRQRGSLLQNHVRIGASHPEGTHSRPQRLAGTRPGFGPIIDVKGTLRQSQGRIGTLEMQAGGQDAMVQRKRRLDQTGDPRRRIQMPDVGLAGSERTLLKSQVATGAERLGQPCNLDGIANRRRRAMGFHIGNRFRINAPQRLRQADDLGVATHTRGGEADFFRTIIVECRPLDHRIDAVAIAHRILHTLENHRARTIAKNRALRLLIKRPAMPVG